MQRLPFAPLCLALLPLCGTGNHLPPTPQQEAMLSQCARKARAISIVEAVFTFEFLFESAALGLEAQQLLPRLQEANVLSGLGRTAAFTRDAPIPTRPWPQRRVGRVGQRFQDQIPQIVSEYLPLIFLGDLDGNSEALKKYPNDGMDECLGGRAQW